MKDLIINKIVKQAKMGYPTFVDNNIDDKAANGKISQQDLDQLKQKLQGLDDYQLLNTYDLTVMWGA